MFKDFTVTELQAQINQQLTADDLRTFDLEKLDIWGANGKLDSSKLTNASDVPTEETESLNRVASAAVPIFGSSFRLISAGSSQIYGPATPSLESRSLVAAASLPGSKVVVYASDPVWEDGGSITFDFRIDGDEVSPGTIKWQFDYGDTLAADFATTPPSGQQTLTFSDGDEGENIGYATFTPVGDSSLEGTEEFSVELLPETIDVGDGDEGPVGTSPPATGVIYDEDDTTTYPHVSIEQASPISEGGLATFRVTRDTAVAAISVGWFTADDTAGADDGDYDEEDSGTITFAANEYEKFIYVQTNVNTDDTDLDESFSVHLQNGSHYFVTTSTATGTIVETEGGSSTTESGSTIYEDDCLCTCVCGVGDAQNELTGASILRVETVGGIALDYNSTSVSNYTMVADWITPDFGLTSSPYDRIKAEFKLGSLYTTTVWYDASSFDPGDSMRVAMQTDASTLATGSYEYSLKLTLVDSTETFESVSRTFLGTTQVVNRGGTSYSGTGFSPYGQGWWLSGLDQLVVNQSIGVTLVTSMGTAYLFKPDGSGFTRAAGQFSDLTYDSGTDTYTLTGPDGTRKTFDDGGRLTKVQDRNDNATTFTYATNQITITNQLGYDTVLDFDSSTRQLTTITDYASRETTFTYASNNKLDTLTKPPADTSTAAQEFDFDYLSGTGLIEKVFKPGSSTNANLQFVYGADEKVSQVQRWDFSASTPTYRNEYLTSYQTASLDYGLGDGSELDPAQLQKTEDVLGTRTDALSQTTTFTTDRFGGITTSNTPSSIGATTTYERDSNGLVTDAYLPDPTSGTASVHYVYAYNGDGQLTSVTYPTVGSVTATEAWTYNSSGYVTSYTDQVSRVTKYTPDTRGNVLSIRRVVGNDDTIVTSESDDVVTSFTYSSAPTGTQQLPGGLVLTMTDPKSNQTVYAYESSTSDPDLGLLTSVTYADTTADEASVSYEYDSSTHMLLAYTDENENVTNYAYDDLDRVIEIKLPKAKTSDLDSDRPKYVYHYNAIGAVDYIDAPASNLAAVVTTGYERTTYKYNFRGQVTDVYLPDPDDGQSNWASSSSDSPHWHYDYDEAGRLIKTTDPRGAETHYAYDEANRLIGKTLADPSTGYADDPSPTSTATNSPRYKYFYDDANNLIKVVNPLGAETRYHYDALGRLDGMTEANPALSGTNSGLADNPDPAATVADAASPRTKYEYYADNQLKKVIDPLAAETRYHYDALGRLDGMTLANPATTGTGAGLADDPDPASSAAVTPRYIYGYDKNSNLTSVTDPMGHVTSYGYDHRDRQTLVREPNPSGGGASGGPQTTTVYDGVGNVVEVIAPPNTDTSTVNHTVYKYDGRNQLTYIYEPDTGGAAVDGSGDPIGPVTAFAYDKAGNRIKLTDPNGNITDFVYDALNRLRKDTNYNGTTGYDREYTYDKANNLTNLVDRNDRHTLYVYDKLNRQTSEFWYASVSTTQQDHFLTYEYDKSGNLLNGKIYTYNGSSIDGTKTIRDYLEYDKLGQAKNYIHQSTGAASATKLSHTFDTNGNRTVTTTQIDYGSGYGTDNTIDRTFDKLSRLTSIKQTGSGVSNKLVTVAYNKLSQVLDVHRYSASTASSGSEVAQTYNYYDGQNRLYIIQHKPSISGTAQTQTLLKYDYYADSSVERQKTENLAANGGGSSWFVWDGVHEYAYDPRGQLTNDDHTPYTFSGSVWSAATTENNEYGYDDAGNRDDVDDINGDVDYGDAGPNNELTDDGVYEYEYDPEGNITKRTHLINGSYTEYAWDNRNRLTKVTDKNSSNVTTQTVEYLYDAFDRRSARILNGSSEHYVYDGLSTKVLYTLTDADALGTSSAPVLAKRYLTALDQIFAQENVTGASGTDVVNWLLADRSGSTRVVLYNDGALKQTIDYDPYGNMAVFDASHSPTTAATMVLYAQLLYDPTINLHFSSTRVYNSSVGRWMSIDTIGFAGGDYNQYRYVVNSSVTYVDPYGTLTPLGTGLIGAAIGGAVGAAIGGWRGGWKGAGKGLLVGAAGGFVAGATFNIVAGKLAAAGVGGLLGAAVADGAAGLAGGLASGTVGETYDALDGNPNTSFEPQEIAKEGCWGLGGGLLFSPFGYYVLGPAIRRCFRPFTNNGTPLNPQGTGQKINIYGEGETPGFSDFATEPRYSLGRPLTQSLPGSSASDIALRDVGLSSTTLTEIQRLVRRGTRITYSVAMEGFEEQSQRLLRQFPTGRVVSRGAVTGTDGVLRGVIVIEIP